MGGHILLRAAAEGLAVFDGIVLLSPMVGLRTGLLRGRPFNRLAAFGNLRPIRDRPIWTGAASPMPGRITSCAERHADKVWWKAQCPDLARGAPTWGWLAAAVRSMALLDRTLDDQPLTTPGLILSAAQDPIIDVAAIRRIRGLLSNFDYATIDGAGHELLREADVPRLNCMCRIGDFLDRRASSAIAVDR
jgi:lysophospholipase